MTDNEIAITVDEFVSKNLKDVPFEEGLPVLKKFVWELGEKTDNDGAGILKIYFNWKSKNHSCCST